MSQPTFQPFVGQRVAFIDDPNRQGFVRRVRKAARKTWWNIDVLIDQPGHDDHEHIIGSISTCWRPLHFV